MKKGNQFYLCFNITDSNGEDLDINKVAKVQFMIGNKIIKYYDGINNEVIYDNDTKKFKIWLKEDETFDFDCLTNFQARVMFNDDTILGTDEEQRRIGDIIQKEKIDVEED